MTLNFTGTILSTVSQKTPTVSWVQNLCLGGLLCLITGLTASCGGFSAATSNRASASPPATVSIFPAAATVASSGAQQFTANVSNTSNGAVTWRASAGTISGTGLFTAPAVTKTTQVSVRATSVADNSKHAGATITVTASNSPPPISISISPTQATIASSGAQQFTAIVSNTSNQAVNWTASAGTISGTGLFTAPAVTTSTQVSLTASSIADTSKRASATITVNPPPPIGVSISPAIGTVASAATKQFAATVNNTTNQAVNWTASAGTISGTGLFTAPAVTTATQVSVKVTSIADTSKQASATITVTAPNSPPPISISISPTQSTIASSGTQQFTAAVSNTINQAVNWTTTAGRISRMGVFTAPALTTTTQVSVTATSIADTSKHASARVTVYPAVQTPEILSTAVPNATTGQLYNTSLVAGGGLSPYRWNIASGALPQGLQLFGTGTISGSTKSAGSFSFSAKVTDSRLQSSTRTFTVVVATSNQPNTIPSTYFGMTLSTIKNWPSGYAGSMGKANGVDWPFLERSKGVYDWYRLDTWVQRAQSEGVPLFYSTDYVPIWAAADPSTCSKTMLNATICTSTVTNIQDWDDFVTALVTRYKGRIQMYELWNEPNNTGFFTGTVDQMVTLTNHMYNIIRRLDPNALISSPGANDTTWLDAYWAAGGVKTVDVVSTHSYPASSNPVAEVICAFRTLPLRALMTKYGIQKPLWDSEGSWGGSETLDDPDLQAAFVARHLILHWACGVQRFYWYQWDGAGLYPYWGVLTQTSGALNQAGLAYESVYLWLNGATMPNSCVMNGAPVPAAPSLYHGIYTCDLTRPGGYQAQAVWDTDGSSTYAAPSQFVQYRDLAGHTYPVPSDHNVTIGAKPIMLEN